MIIITPSLKTFEKAGIMRKRSKTESFYSEYFFVFIFILIFIIILVANSFAVNANPIEITNFGSNPGKLKMYLLIPDKVAENAPVLVVPHACHGKAQDLFTSQWTSLANSYGFYVIYPNANSSDSCWNVSSNAALTHNGGSDPGSIVSMVKYVINTYKADSTRVYVSGHSSGGMITNVLLGSYPDVFAAGAAFAGVPFGCFAGTSTWNSSCASGSISKSAEEWGDLVRAAYPNFSGSRPKIQLWHGTNDDVLNFKNFSEEIKQWTNVLGVSQTPTSTENNTPMSSWIRTRYSDNSGNVMVEAIQEVGQPHNLQVRSDLAAEFFSLDKTVAVRRLSHNVKLKNETGPDILISGRNSSNSITFTVVNLYGTSDISVVNLSGKKLTTLTKNCNVSGTRSFVWNRTDMRSCPYSHGIYMLMITINKSAIINYRFYF